MTCEGAVARPSASPTALFESAALKKRGLMLFLEDWRSALGALSVVMAFVAFAIYAWQAMAGQIRPHPLSWFLFGILSVVGYWVQRDEGAHAGSWVLLAMILFCFLLAAVGFVRGERRFPIREWAFLAAAAAVLLVYVFTRQPTLAAVLISIIDALGYGPTFSRGWSHPHRDSATSFAINAAKFVPSLLAMKPISIATCVYPATLLGLNVAVTLMLVLRRRALARPKLSA
jgi:hypothetical protein